MAGPTTGSLGDLRLPLLPLLLVATLIFFANLSYADEIFLTVNVKKPLALTSDKFLSYTLDPTLVFTGDALTRNPERSINMARALSPAFVRIGGPRSNSYTFVRPNRMHYEEDPNFTITESNWIDVNRWAENSGLDVLVCITPQHTEIGGGDSVWDSRNALDLISFSDHMGFNTSWQLGYECQTRCDVTGIDSGKAVMRLRSMLDAFPRYSKSLITGPDVVAYRTKQQQQYLQDYLSVAGNALSAITWHPNFSGVTLDDEGVSMQHDSLTIDRDNLYRHVGRSIWKKPLWIAESKPEDCKKQFLGALVWTRRLGNAARLGVQVIMRQPNGSNLLQPTPDYWVSVLHKALVGREVLDARITNGNRSHVHFYCQCTRPSSKYEKGSLTIFGINLTPEKILINLKSLKVKTIHKYILLPGMDADNRMFSETVLLNNVPLKLVNERELPTIRPAVVNSSKGASLKLPSGGIGFWVLPGLKIKSCGGLEDESTDKTSLKRLSKRLGDSESDEENFAGLEGNYNEDIWMKPNKNRKRSKQYYNGEEVNERSYIKIEAKKDLEKLEKLLRKRESSDDRTSMWRGRKSFSGFDDRRPEKWLDERNFEDETSRELRDKLKEYRRRLKQYEYKIQKIEPLPRAYGLDSEETVDSEKVIDAMRLISKMENTMRKLEVGDKMNNENFEKYGTSDVQRTSNDPRSADDTFLDKLLDSKKIKRTSVPSRIEDQLREIYQMLADEKERRRRNNPGTEQKIEKKVDVVSSTADNGNFTRSRRDADKKFGVDPLGLRKEGLYRRLSWLTDETRERRNRRKEERIDRHAFIIDSKDASDSDEEDFYGFRKREPVKNFPKGDVHLSIGNSEEEASSDYDYEIDDEEERHVNKKTKNIRRRKTPRATFDDDKDLWVEVQTFDKKRGISPRIHKNVIGHSELWEDESNSQKTEDTSSAEIDKLVTVQEIVPEQHPDAQKEQRTKELVVEKLISYFKGPSVQRDEIRDYESAEKLEPMISDSRTPVKRTTSRDESNLKVGFDPHYQTPVVKRENVEGEKEFENKSYAISNESETLTAVKSIDFHESNGSSEEEETIGSVDTSYKITDEPANRKKRSINNLLEDVLQREMIFEDDNNLKDCDCRVPRSTGGEKVGDIIKKKRLNCPLKKSLGSARRGPRRPSVLRKNRKREETLVSKQTTSQRESNSRSTRRKRSLESATERMVEEKSTLLANYKSVDPPRPENTNHEDLPKNDAKPDGEATKNLALNTEMMNDMIDPETTRHVVKRGDKSRSSSNVVQSEGTNFDTGDSSTTKIEATQEQTATTIAPNTKFFRLRKNRKESARKLNETTEETSHSDSATVPSVGAVRSPLYKSNKMVSSRKTLTTTTDAPSSAAVPEENFEETTTEIEEPDAIITKSTKTNKKREKPESAVSKLRRKIVTTSSTTPLTTATNQNLRKTVTSLTTETPPKMKKLQKTTTTPAPITASELQEKQQTTTMTPLVALRKNNDEKKLLRSKKIQQFLQKILETSTSPGVASVNNDDEKKSVKPKKSDDLPRTTSSPGTAPKKNNNEKRSLKSKNPETLQKLSRTTSSPLSTSVKSNDDKKLLKSKNNDDKKLLKSKNNDDKKWLKSKRTELLEKLQEKLREKREKLLNDYREELLSELEAVSEENKHIYRREIMNMMMDETELRDLVDQAKFQYLKHNKPIDYEATRELDNVNNTEEIGQKHVPEMTEIVKPLQVTRERKVKPRNENVETTTNPGIVTAQEEVSKADNMSLRLRDDGTNHKIARRDGKPYHSMVDEPSIYEKVFHDETSIEMKGSTELDESMESSSVRQNDKQMVVDYAEENRFDYSDEFDDVDYGSILDPNDEERIQSLKMSEELENPMRDAGSYNHVLLKKNSEVSPSKRSDEKLIEDTKDQISHQITSEDNKEADVKTIHLSKKRNLKNSDFDTDSKYDSPKYARLSVDKSGFLQSDKVEGTNVNRPESEETLKKVGSKILKKKKVEPGDENPSWIVKRLMDDFQENHSAMIDYADLDEALNSGDYELVMLIPVNSDQKKHRRKRHVENQITRDPEHSVRNDVTIEMMPKKLNERFLKEDAKINYDNLNIQPNEIARNPMPSMDLMDGHEKDDYSMAQYSIPLNNKRLETSDYRDIKILRNELPRKETFVSVPERVLSYGENILSDNELPGSLKEAIPKLEATVAGDIGKVRRISGSFEKFIHDFDNKFDQKEFEFKTENDTPDSNAEYNFPTSSNIFGTTFATVKKMFSFLSGLVYALGDN